MSIVRPIALLVVVFLSLAATANAQAPAPPPPPPGWTGSASAGLALTQGNSDTSTVNLAYEVKRDTGSKLLFKSSGLFLRGESEGELTTNRMAIGGRVDRKLSERTSLFGQTQFLRDSFKAIDYLVSPTAGISRLLVKKDRTELGVDAGLGVVWEKNPGLDVKASGAVSASETVTHKLTKTAEFTQKVAALWKMDDFDDSLYAFTVGLAASVTTATQLKVELLDTFKNKPPSADIVKNDIAVLVSFVYKF